MTINWDHAKVLVCGGAGMIGSHMSKRLLKLGADVCVADNLSSGSKKNINTLYVDFKEYDLRDKDVCEELAKGKDVVFQYAARMGGIGFITSHFADVMYDNAMINLNVLEAARKYDVPNYFFSSSACVYPNYKQKEADVVPLRESDAMPADPNEPYGWEKFFTEKLVESYQHDYDMSIRVARFHNIYGSVFTAFDKEKGKAPCHLIMKAVKHPNPEFVLWGDGKCTRSYLYIDDCIDGVLKLMDSDYALPINIGSDRLISVDDLAKIIIDISRKDIIPEHDLTKPEGVKGRNADLALVRKVLNWEPKVSLEDGLKRVYHWAEEHLSELEGI